MYQTIPPSQVCLNAARFHSDSSGRALSPNRLRLNHARSGAQSGMRKSAFYRMPAAWRAPLRPRIGKDFAAGQSARCAFPPIQKWAEFYYITYISTRQLIFRTNFSKSDMCLPQSRRAARQFI
jgi:hypothetical protein